MTTAQQIVAGLGGKWSGSSAMARCPAHDDRSPSLLISEAGGKPLLYCYAGCSQAEVLGALKARELWDGGAPAQHSDEELHKLEAKARAQREADRRQRIEMAKLIWGETVDPTTTLAETYLRRRGLPVETIPPALRFHSKLPCVEAGRPLPALVAGVSGPGGEIIGVQRTWLNSEGTKMDVPAPKKTLGAVSGGAVRLSKARDHISLVEGIEDGIAYGALFDCPVAWPVLGVSGFVSFSPPAGTKRITFAADNDKAGRGAALEGGERLEALGFHVDVRLPPAPLDCNDLWIAFEERAAAIEYEGGTTRREAEREALAQFFDRNDHAK